MITVHILLMDELLTLSEVLSEVLEEENVQVTAPGTVFEDVSQIERLQPDLIVMALRRDGTQQRVWTCVQHLKSHQATKDIPVVLYNGYVAGGVGDIVQGQEVLLAQEGIEIFSQPFNLDAFHARLRQRVADLETCQK